MQAFPATVPSITLQDTISSRAAGLRQRLATLSNHADGSHDLELRKQLEEFASLLVFQMFQAMRRTVPKSGLLNSGFAQDFYMSLLDQELSRHVAQREAMGLAPLLERQLGSNGKNFTTARHQVQALESYRQQQSLGYGGFSVPLHGTLTSEFGKRSDPFDAGQAWHNGVDIAAPAGSLIRAAASGYVIFNGTQPGYGNLLIIEHQNGYQTYYAHNAENLVTVGSYVEQAQPIARVGSTGRVTGPHVHFEVRQHGRAVDPGPLLHGMSSG